MLETDNDEESRVLHDASGIITDRHDNIYAFMKQLASVYWHEEVAAVYVADVAACLF